LRQVAFGHDQAHWSSDGSRTAMDAGLDDGRITTALMDADGSSLTIMPIPDPTRRAWSARSGSRATPASRASSGTTSTRSASPEGRKLLYDDSRGDIVVSRPDGSRRHQVTLAVSGIRFAWEPSWSPDGERIVFSMFTRRSKDTVRLGIYTAAADGSDVRTVAPATEGAFSNADWGPAR
jgi:hypothetical protein